jgi:hypothetical protein
MKSRRAMEMFSSYLISGLTFVAQSMGVSGCACGNRPHPEHKRRISRAQGAACMSVNQAEELSAYDSRCAASASSASLSRNAKNSLDWPMNSPSFVSALTAPAAASWVRVGRMIETFGNFRLRKMVGSGMFRLACRSSPADVRSGKVSPFVGSVSAGALPALSCHVWKCAVSVGPILSKIRKTSVADPLRQ